MPGDDYIPSSNQATLSLACAPCGRRTYFDAHEACQYLRRRGWLPLLSVVTARFVCKQCGARPVVRVVSYMARTTPLLPPEPLGRIE